MHKVRNSLSTERSGVVSLAKCSSSPRQPDFEILMGKDKQRVRACMSNFAINNYCLESSGEQENLQFVTAVSR